MQTVKKDKNFNIGILFIVFLSASFFLPVLLLNTSNEPNNDYNVVKGKIDSIFINNILNPQKIGLLYNTDVLCSPTCDDGW